jgi:hypothetical protein
LDRSPNAFRILHNLVGGKTSNTPSLLFHDSCAPCVLLELGSVMIAIDFNDKLSRYARNVRKKSTDGMLTPELCAFKPMSPN